MNFKCEVVILKRLYLINIPFLKLCDYFLRQKNYTARVVIFKYINFKLIF